MDNQPKKEQIVSNSTQYNCFRYNWFVRHFPFLCQIPTAFVVPEGFPPKRKKKVKSTEEEEKLKKEQEELKAKQERKREKKEKKAKREKKKKTKPVKPTQPVVDESGNVLPASEISKRMQKTLKLQQKLIKNKASEINKARAYLDKWSTCKEQWKFKKLRQMFIQKHILCINVIDDAHLDIAIQYLASANVSCAKSLSRCQSIVDVCGEYLHTH